MFQEFNKPNVEKIPGSTLQQIVQHVVKYTENQKKWAEAFDQNKVQRQGDIGGEVADKNSQIKKDYFTIRDSNKDAAKRAKAIREQLPWLVKKLDSKVNKWVAPYVKSAINFRDAETGTKNLRARVINGLFAAFSVVNMANTSGLNEIKVETVQELAAQGQVNLANALENSRDTLYSAGGFALDTLTLGALGNNSPAEASTINKNEPLTGFKFENNHGKAPLSTPLNFGNDKKEEAEPAIKRREVLPPTNTSNFDKTPITPTNKAVINTPIESEPKPIPNTKKPKSKEKTELQKRADDIIKRSNQRNQESEAKGQAFKDSAPQAYKDAMRRKQIQQEKEELKKAQERFDELQAEKAKKQAELDAQARQAELDAKNEAARKLEEEKNQARILAEEKAAKSKAEGKNPVTQAGGDTATSELSNEQEVATVNKALGIDTSKQDISEEVITEIEPVGEPEEIKEVKNIEEVINDNLSEDEIAIVLENKGDLAFLGKTISPEFVPADSKVVDTFDGVKVYQGIRDGNMVIFAYDGKNYREVKAEYLEGEGLTPELAAKATSGEGISTADIEELQDKNSNRSFTAEEFKNTSEGNAHEKYEEISQGNGWKIIGRPNPTTEFKNQVRALGGDPDDNGADLALTINGLADKPAEQQIRFWKSASKWMGVLNKDDSNLTDYERNVAVALYAADVDPSKGITPKDLNRVQSLLSPSGGEALERAAGIYGTLQNIVAQDFRKYNPREVAPLLRRAERFLKSPGSIYQDDAEVEKLVAALQDVKPSRHNITDNEGSMQSLEVRDLLNEIRPIVQGELEDMQDLAYRQNLAAEDSNSDMRMAINAKGETLEGEITDVEGNKLGSESEKEANETWGVNPFKSAFVWFGGSKGLSFNHKDEASVKVMQPGTEHKYESIKAQQLDGGTETSESVLIPKPIDKTLQVLRVASLVVPSIKAILPPFYYNESRTTVTGGNSTGLMEKGYLDTQQGAAINVATDAIENQKAISKAVNNGADSIEAIMEVLGVSREQAQEGASILYLMSKADSSAYTELTGVKAVNISVPELKNTVEFAKSIQTAAGVEIDTADIENDSKKLAKQYNAQLENAQKHKTLRAAFRGDVNQFESNKFKQTQLMNAIAGRKIGQVGDYTVEYTTLGELGNVSTTGDVIAINTVGVDNNTRVTARTVRAPQETKVMIVRGKNGKIITDDEGNTKFYYDQCANGAAANPGSVFKDTKLKENKIICHVCVTPLDNQMAIDPNLPLLEYLTSDDGKKARALNVGSDSSQRKSLKNVYRASQEANEHNPNVLRNIKSDIKGMNSQEIAAYLDAKNINAKNKIMGISIGQHINDWQTNPQYNHDSDELLFKTPRITNLLAVTSDIKAQQNMTLSGNFDKQSNTTTHENNYMTDHANVRETIKVTDTLKKTEGSFAGKFKERAEATVLTETVYYLQKVRDARVKAGLPCKELDEYVTLEFGVSLEEVDGNGHLQFVIKDESQSVEKDKVVEPKEKPPEVVPPAPEPKPEPISDAPDEEIIVDTPEAEEPVTPEPNQDLTQPPKEEVVTPPTPPSNPTTSPELPPEQVVEKPPVEPIDKVVEGNPTVHEPGNIQPQQPLEIKDDQPPVILDDKVIEGNPTVQTPPSTFPSNEEAENGFANLTKDADDGYDSFINDAVGDEPATGSDFLSDTPESSVNYDFLDDADEAVIDFKTPANPGGGQ